MDTYPVFRGSDSCVEQYFSGRAGLPVIFKGLRNPAMARGAGRAKEGLTRQSGGPQHGWKRTARDARREGPRVQNAPSAPDSTAKA